jgi:hypothetical protein
MRWPASNEKPSREVAGAAAERAHLHRDTDVNLG